ncbi:hypothetical protein [Pseudomonas oryzihabitans]|uniref:Uncharacterized protein n=1 Tax=Pseudomonas oryzihabitans TaxID=47885 RepID=A0AAJ2EVD3_9PSED|nr:hypothetical protein [Pseudomonas psychrotolerans]KTT10743.1 hypothetical protein NS2R_17325 [Pseudomonas psychrotolerans]MDR6233562.1 hypothetical protein [Pseudomonas psychrotolerans]MDR6357395.1 hypothetical protein [Pseudomonas psychrotolerans]QDD91304.1 hypothetical protein CCZ28_20725 [Pseudomonas psychrotolerans]
MPAELCIPLQLTPAQARAYLRWLAAQYRAGLQEHWWDDRYRTVPAGPLRRWRIHQDHPALAAVADTARALRAELRTLEQRP